jgi:hypothetical protein
MVPLELPPFLTPYLKHPLVESVRPKYLADLDNQLINGVIQAEDLIYRGLREYYKADRIKRLHSGHFGSSVQIARAWSFLDMAYPSCNVRDVVNKVYNLTKTTNEPQFLKNMYESVLPRLEKNNLITFDKTKTSIADVIPYPVGSKLYVKNELLGKPILYNQQINQFTILNQVQYCPALKTALQADSSIKKNFDRDYEALSEIEVIRTRSVRNREFTLSKAYLTGDHSIQIWNTILESGERTRTGLKELLDIQGNLGGCVSQSEFSRLTSKNMRLVGSLMRRIDALGISQRVQTLELEDALSRPISGTRLNLNYQKLNNAQSFLIFARSVPETPDIVYKVKTEQLFDEDVLSSEFDPRSVSKVKNSLQNIGVLIEENESEGIWKVAQNNESNLFLDDVLKVLANTRSVLGENIEINRKLEEFFPDNEADIRRNFKEIEKDFLENFES